MLHNSRKRITNNYNKREYFIMNYKKTFELPFGVISFDEDFLKYNELRNEYESMASSIAEEFCISVKKKNTDMKALVENCEKDFLTYLLPSIDKTLEKIVNEGFYDIDRDFFMQNFYIDDHYYFSRGFSDIIDDYYAIVLEKEQLDQYRTMRRENRGKIVGGGFGVGGAVQGIAMAGAANLAIGALHGTFNLFGSMISSMKTNSQLRDTFKSKKLDKALFSSAYWSIFDIHLAFIEAYQSLKEEKYGRKPSQDEIDRSIRYFENIKGNKIPGNKVDELLCTTIQLNPYNKDIYTYAISKYGDEKSLTTSLAELFSIDLDTFKENQIIDIYNEGIKSCETEDDYINLKNKMHAFAKTIAAKEDSDIFESIQKIIKKFDMDFRTIDGIEYETRNDARIAKDELSWIIPLIKNLDKEHYKDDLASVIKKLKDAGLKSKGAIEKLNELLKIKDGIDLKARTIDGLVYSTQEDADVAKKELEWIDPALGNLNKSNEDEVSFLIERIKSKNIKSQGAIKKLNELLKIKDNLDIKTRTVDGFVYSTREDADIALIELTWWQQQEDVIINGKYQDIEKLLEDIKKKKLTSELSKIYFKKLNEKILDLKTTQGIVFDSMKQADNARNEYKKLIDRRDQINFDDIASSEAWINELRNHSLGSSFLKELINQAESKLDEKRENITTLAIEYNKIRNRGLTETLFLYVLGIIASFFIIKWLGNIGIGIVILVYVSVFLEKHKQKKAWKELTKDGSYDFKEEGA
jgi:hypothetical protein